MRSSGCNKIIFSSSATVYRPAKTVADLPWKEGEINLLRNLILLTYLILKFWKK